MPHLAGISAGQKMLGNRRETPRAGMPGRDRDRVARISSVADQGRDVLHGRDQIFLDLNPPQPARPLEAVAPGARETPLHQMLAGADVAP